uniref:Uncharacterized protein n=1 Tax=viral metagenome TaxID=1070528 RepID=A0A6C0AFY3_9ZZZZ
MLDRQIISYISQDEELYQIFQIIADFNNTDIKSFSSKGKILKTIKNIFKSHGIKQKNTDYRIKKISYDGFEMIGFSVFDREDVHKLFLLIDCIHKLSDQIMDKYKICLTALAFVWDSPSCIVFAVEDITDEQDNYEYEIDLRDKVENYLKKEVDNDEKVYGLDLF